MARSLIMAVENFRATIFLIVYAVKAVPSGAVEFIRKLSKSSSNSASANILDSVNAEKLGGVSDVVTHLAPFLSSSLDPTLIFFKVGVNMLYLADVPGGKPEWALVSIIAIVLLWDRQGFSSDKESIARDEVTNLHLLNLHMRS